MKIKSIVVQIIVIILLLATSVWAQNFPVDKGSTTISGSFTISTAGGTLYDRFNEDRRSNYELDPAANFFVLPGFAIGGKLLFSRTAQGDYHDITWGIGPEVNYYLGVDKDRHGGEGSLYRFLQAGFFYTSTSIDLGDFKESQTGTKIRLGVGIAYMISDGAALAVTAAYDIDSQKTEDQESFSGNKFGIYGNLIIFLY
jgi:hypothetical protein